MNEYEKLQEEQSEIEREIEKLQEVWEEKEKRREQLLKEQRCYPGERYTRDGEEFLVVKAPGKLITLVSLTTGVTIRTANLYMNNEGNSYTLEHELLRSDGGLFTKKVPVPLNLFQVYYIYNVVSKKKYFNFVEISKFSDMSNSNQDILLLEHGEHPNRHLQNSFKKYGKHAFVIVPWCQLASWADARHEMGVLINETPGHLRYNY